MSPWPIAAMSSTIRTPRTTLTPALAMEPCPPALPQRRRTTRKASPGLRRIAGSCPSASLMDEYEKVADGDAKDDPRYNATFYFIGDAYNNGKAVLANWGWKKYQTIYKKPDEAQRSGINMRVMRYTEVLLNMAEVQNALGNDNGTDGAIALLNEVRSRVDVAMPNYPTAKYPVNSADEVLKAIVHERRVELAGEQIRNRDILRWRSLGKIPAVIPEPISYMAPKHLLAPIPQAEINSNAVLTEADQNTGW